MGKKSTLSVVLATFNEEKNIEECLLSVRDIADEMIVVDGTSTDKTVAIAKKLGAKVVIEKNRMLFHINKQKAIDLATKDWILQLDADERLTSELKKEIEEILLHPEREADGYWIPRKNWFLGRFLMKGGQYPDYTLRLYRRGKGSLPQKDVHEQAVVEGEVGYLTSPLIHFADPSFSRYLLRWGRYTDLMAKELKEKRTGFLTGLSYIFVKPVWWFGLSYIRHKGFMDSWQGFVFSLFSSLRFPVSYIKYLMK